MHDRYIDYASEILRSQVVNNCADECALQARSGTRTAGDPNLCIIRIHLTVTVYAR